MLEMLFSAFEKHQYYNLKDLVRITNQPVVSERVEFKTYHGQQFKFNQTSFVLLQGYLKEVLKEVCNYCVKNPHKNMWELKPEYRHYKEENDD